MLNDITAGRADQKMFELLAEVGHPVVLMHMLGSPADMQRQPRYEDVVGDKTNSNDAGEQALIWFAVESGDLELFNYLAPKYDVALINKNKREISQEGNRLGSVNEKEWDVKIVCTKTRGTDAKRNIVFVCKIKKE